MINDYDIISFPLAIDKTPNAITCEELHLLYTAGHQLKRTFDLIEQDLRIINQLKKEIVYALDFSEIFTYLWPNKSSSFNYEVSLNLLQSNNIKYTILPGTAIELAKHLKRFSRSSAEFRSKYDNLMNNPIASSIIDSIFKKEKDTLNMYNLSNSSSKLSNVLSELSELGGVFSRLRMLKKLENVSKFSEEIQYSDPELSTNDEILTESLMSLNLRRPEFKNFNNYIDALNYALVWSLSLGTFRKSNRLYYLITSSPIPYYVFRNLKWGRTSKERNTFPDLNNYSLVRHPVHVLYLSRLLDINFAGRDFYYLRLSLNSLLNYWLNNESYQKFIAGNEKPTKIVKLPTSKKYFKSLYSFKSRYFILFSEIRNAIESDIITESNFRVRSNIHKYSLGISVQGDNDNLKSSISIRDVYKLLDNITNEATLYVKQAEQAIKSMPSKLRRWADPENIIGVGPKLKLKQSMDNEFKVHGVSVFIYPSDILYFSSELYKDHYTFWWNTKMTFKEFIGQAIMLNNSISNSIDVDELTEVLNKKIYHGIYLFSAHKSEPEYLKLHDINDLSLAYIIELIQNKEFSMVRISLDSFDLYYDFHPLHSIPRRASIVSSLPISGPLAKFIYITNEHQTGLKAVTNMVYKCISLFQKHEN